MIDYVQKPRDDLAAAVEEKRAEREAVRKKDQELAAWLGERDRVRYGTEESTLPPLGAASPETKATNPKDAIGSGKLPLELVPDTAVALESLAFLEGATKYGRFNWRVAGVRSSIYTAALRRHLAAWWNGEDADPATGVPHLASVRACAGILIDAGLCGKLTDDRPPRAPVGELQRDLAAEVPRIRGLYPDASPHQYTIDDGEG